MGGFFMFSPVECFYMQAFILNLTRILEKNPKVYASIIVAIVLCLSLFVAEAVHIQNLAAALNTKDQAILTAAIEPISSRYSTARIILLLAGFIWSSIEFSRSKKQLGL